ncbi:MAG: hypothetical protein WCK60_01260 [Candidatus Nomurabacteria bacterium]
MTDITLTPEENLSSKGAFLAYLKAQGLAKLSDRTCYVARAYGREETFCVRGTRITLCLTDKIKLSQSLPDVFEGTEKGYTFYVISSLEDDFKLSPFWDELESLLLEADRLKLERVLLTLVMWLIKWKIKSK